MVGSAVVSSALLIHVAGPDRPGLTFALTSILARCHARILDIGQAVIHDALALGILIELPDELRSSALLTDLLLEAHRLGVQVRFSASSSAEYGE
jgi:phosphoserine phosphatase